MSSIPLTTTNECCRSCNELSNHDNSSHLYETTINNIKLSEMFIRTTSISINPYDGLSDIICEFCQSLLVSAYEFQQKSIQTDKLIRSQLNIVDSEFVTNNVECINAMPLDVFELDIKLENEINNDDCIDSNALSHNNSDFDDEDCLPLKTSTTDKKSKRKSPLKSITAKRNTYKCDNCNKCFDKRLHFKRHQCKQFDDVTKLPIWVPKQKKSKKEHKCHVCGKLFDKNIRRERHLKYHDPTGQPYECTTCKYRFTTEGSLRRHEVKHSKLLADIKKIPAEVPVFSCSQCTAKFDKQQSFASHMKTHKSPNNDGFTCNHCPEKFTDSAEWRQHVIAHGRDNAKKNNVECHICGQRFVYKSLLMDHIIRKHETEKPFICYCNRGFNSESMLKYHQRVHTNERPYLCSECGLGFKSGSALKQHLLIHTGEKEFLCSECPSRFRNKGLLTYHLRMHTGNRPFSCEICHKTFVVNSELTKHKRIHTDIRPFSCTMCEKKFRKNTTLKQHILTHTGEKPYNCTYCNRAFSQSHELRTHIRCHIGDNTYQCKQCSCNFRFYRELRAHEQYHYSGEKKVSSDVQPVNDNNNSGNENEGEE